MLRRPLIAFFTIAALAVVIAILSLQSSAAATTETVTTTKSALSTPPAAGSIAMQCGVTDEIIGVSATEYQAATALTYDGGPTFDGPMFNCIPIYIIICIYPCNPGGCWVECTAYWYCL